MFWAIPKRNITSPIKRNNGTGRREKEVIDLKMFNMSWVKPISPQKI